MYDAFGNYVGPELTDVPKKKKRKRTQQVCISPILSLAGLTPYSAIVSARLRGTRWY